MEQPRGSLFRGLPELSKAVASVKYTKVPDSSAFADPLNHLKFARHVCSIPIQNLLSEATRWPRPRTKVRGCGSSDRVSAFLEIGWRHVFCELRNDRPGPIALAYPPIKEQIRRCDVMVRRTSHHHQCQQHEKQSPQHNARPRIKPPLKTTISGNRNWRAGQASALFLKLSFFAQRHDEGGKLLDLV